MIIGEGYRVLASLVYGEFINEFGGNPRLASNLSILILTVTFGALLIQRRFARRASFDQETVTPLGLRKTSITKIFVSTLIVYAIVFIAFLPTLTVVVSSLLLIFFRNASLHSLQYKTELALVKVRNIDITNFENELNSFKSGFVKNYDLVLRKFQTAIEEIDKSIDHLQKTKDSLIGNDRNLKLANNKAQDMTIKKLTRRNSTMAEKFSRLEKS